MKKMKKWNEKDHIKAIGPDVFNAMFLGATLALKEDARLTGSSQLRLEIAHEIALRVTGAPIKAFVPSKRLGLETDWIETLICDVARRLTVAT